MKNIVTVFFITFICLLNGESVYGCSCPKFGSEVLTREQEIKRIVGRNGTAVFAGEVIDINNDTDQLYYRDVTFKVKQYWSGNISEEFTIRSFQPTSSCGFDFRAGTSYLMFAYLHEFRLYADECYGIQELQRAVEDLKYLG